MSSDLPAIEAHDPAVYFKIRGLYLCNILTEVTVTFEQTLVRTELNKY